MTFKLTYVLLIAGGCALAGYFLRGSPQAYYDQWKSLGDSLVAMNEKMIQFHDSLSRAHEESASRIDTAIQKEAKRIRHQIADVAQKTPTSDTAVKYYWDTRAVVPGSRISGRLWALDDNNVGMELPEFRHVIATSVALTSTTTQLNLSTSRAEELSGALSQKHYALRQAQATIAQLQWIIDNIEPPETQELFGLSIEVAVHGMWGKPFLDMNEKLYNVDVPIDIHTNGLEISFMPVGFIAYPENGKLQSGTTHGVRGKIKLL